MRSLSMALVILLGLCGCIDPEQSECRTSQDCQPSLFCKIGRCTLLDEGATSAGSPIATGDAGADADTSQQASHPCPQASSAGPTSLLLNEVLAAVPQGESGDANGDDERHYHDDEFVELVNISEQTLDLSGVQILNDNDLRHTFAAHCLPPDHAVVVFGGVADGQTPLSPQGAKAFVADKRLGFADGGGRVVVRSAAQEIIADLSYSDHPPGSLNRQIDMTDADFVSHQEISDLGLPFSPGTCASGTDFSTKCQPEDDGEGDNNQGDGDDGESENLSDYKGDD